MDETDELKNKKQNPDPVFAAVMSVILLIVSFAVAGLLFTFTQVLGGDGIVKELEEYLKANNIDPIILIVVTLMGLSLVIILYMRFSRSVKEKADSENQIDYKPLEPSMRGGTD